MATTIVTDNQEYTGFFHRRVLINIQYWQDYVTNHSADVLALDRERERVIIAVSFALNLDETWPAVYHLIVTFAPYVERRGDWGVWNQLLERAIQAAQHHRDTTRSITLSALLARLLQRQSRLKEAISYYRKAIRLARQTTQRFEEARACSNLGYLCAEQGYWHRAEVLCCHALAIFEQLDSDHGRAHTENHLGILYTRQRSWDKARQHLEHACAIWRSMSDDHGLMLGFLNLGMLEVDSEHPDQALAHLEKALYYARRAGEELLTGNIYLNIGIAHRLKTEPIRAEAYARQAELVFQRFSYLTGLAMAADNLGLACQDQEKWSEAQRHFKCALDNWRTIKNIYGEARTLIYLMEYELVRHNDTEARAWVDHLERLNEQYRWAKRYPYLHQRFQENSRSVGSKIPN